MNSPCEQKFHFFLLSSSAYSLYIAISMVIRYFDCSFIKYRAAVLSLLEVIYIFYQICPVNIFAKAGAIICLNFLLYLLFPFKWLIYRRSLIF